MSTSQVTPLFICHEWQHGFHACNLLCYVADREVQRILLELLNQMDGFDQTVNVKVL